KQVTLIEHGPAGAAGGVEQIFTGDGSSKISRRAMNYVGDWQSSILLFVTALVVSILGVGLFRSWSRRHGFFDVPNERSSHSTPTLRGGGIIIVLVTLIA